MEEKWKDVIGFEGKYQVSNLGRVKSLSKKLGEKRKEIIMLSNVSVTRKRSYPKVNLGRNNCRTVHRLVASAFIPNPENKQTVNHIDGNKLNNKLSNLEWSTFRENNQHAKKLGLWTPQIQNLKFKKKS